MAHTLSILAAPASTIKKATAEDLYEVRCEADGSVVIHASAEAAALLAGREMFGDLRALQQALEDRIADAWYAADCPRES